MNKKELLEKLVELKANDKIISVVEEFLKAKERSIGDNSKRMQQVLDVLRANAEEGISVEAMAELLGLSNKNISSYLTYLRKRGFKIWTFEGRKYLKETGEDD